MASNSGAMARDSGEMMANQAMMHQLAPYLAVGDLASRWSPKMPKFSLTRDSVIGGNIGGEIKVGSFLDVGGGLKIGAYTDTSDKDLARLLVTCQLWRIGCKGGSFLCSTGVTMCSQAARSLLD